MSNVMNYNQFMSEFKKAEAGYRAKGNVAAGKEIGHAKVDQNLTDGPIKGKGTPALDKYTKQYLSAVKSKKVGK
jgi:hypothetical protein